MVSSNSHIIINTALLMSCFSISVFCTVLLKFPKAKLSAFPVLLKLQNYLVLRMKYSVIHSDSKQTNPFFLLLLNSQENQLNLNLISGYILPCHINFISDALPPLQVLQGTKNLAETGMKYLLYFFLKSMTKQTENTCYTNELGLDADQRQTKINNLIPVLLTWVNIFPRKQTQKSKYLQHSIYFTSMACTKQHGHMILIINYFLTEKKT